MNRAVLIAAGEYREEYVFSEKDDLGRRRRRI